MENIKKNEPIYTEKDLIRVIDLAREQAETSIGTWDKYSQYEIINIINEEKNKA